jgi:ribonuclease D
LPKADKPYVWVDDNEGLKEAADAMEKASRLGVDTEADSRHHYPEKTCLIQVAVGDIVYVIDPLAPTDITMLKGALEDRRIEKIFHGADFDLRGLNRDWGIVCRNVFDTNIAARFAGLERFGYAALVEDLLGKTIPKDPRLQKADWSKRPLSDEALEYASADVLYLDDVRDALVDRIRHLGRSDWVAEELERVEQVRYSPPDLETAYFSVKGAHKLDGKALGVLKELWDLRESEARRLDRPPAFVMPAEAMVTLASKPETDLADVPSLGPPIRRRLGGAIGRAIKAGLASGPLKRPPPQRPFLPRPTHEEMERLKKLKDWRTAEGEKLSMDPSLIWPMRSLERLSRDPKALDEELASPDVRRWQRHEFEPAIRAVLGLG